MDAIDDLPELVLMRLGDGCPALTPDCGRSLAEAAAVCLEDQGHRTWARLIVIGEYEVSFRIIWPVVTDQMIRCYNDPEEATENGACGIAILLVQELAGLVVVERSRKGTGFDYWLGSEEGYPFQNQARLEVSGIRAGSAPDIKARVKQKLQQTQQSDALLLPAYVVVVEFSRPIAEVTKR
jgi:hypothetical protein